MNKTTKLTKKEIIEIKERERLFWEYARRSKELNRFYDHFRKKDGPALHPLPQAFNLPISNPGKIMEIFDSESFEDYWEKFGKSWAAAENNLLPPTVANFLEYLPERIENDWKRISHEKGRAPTLDESGRRRPVSHPLPTERLVPTR
jgi:hypothetical protein